MAKSFIQFLKQKITVSVLITVVVFNIFNPVADDIFTPLVGYIVDPSKYLEDSKITLNSNYEMKYGIIIKQFIASIVVLGLIYYVDKFFF
jgi:large-conductance mechanosensitive channel